MLVSRLCITQVRGTWVAFNFVVYENFLEYETYRDEVYSRVGTTHIVSVLDHMPSSIEIVQYILCQRKIIGTGCAY